MIALRQNKGDFSRQTTSVPQIKRADKRTCPALKEFGGPACAFDWAHRNMFFRSVGSRSSGLKCWVSCKGPYAPFSVQRNPFTAFLFVTRDRV
ncbi:hypothetical protein Nepgr_002116 [Nepenthes gracilis]|uniref:Uncharacterized protein n=1 Tax=Nepenthes gracilis TaxID=150966 RepID=A0AAD3P9K7_NEPGR|nr:hypothetical protein Nepgr_002116 [Nepenthes gracilis]